MGYCVTVQVDVNILDPEKCLTAINELHKDRKNYSWVNNPPNGRLFDDIKQAFRAWRYDVCKIDNNLVVCGFLGEKFGEDELFWKTVAPHVEGEVIFHGEDNYMWKYEFKDGKFLEKEAKIDWI